MVAVGCMRLIVCPLQLNEFYVVSCFRNIFVSVIFLAKELQCVFFFLKKKFSWRNALKGDCLAKKTVVMQSGMGLEWGEEYLGNVAVLKQEVNLK